MRVHDLSERSGIDGILIDGINAGSHSPHHRPDDISRQPRDAVDGEQALSQRGLPDSRSASDNTGSSRSSGQAAQWFPLTECPVWGVAPSLLRPPWQVSNRTLLRSP